MIESSPAVVCVIGDLSSWDKPKNREALIELINSGAISATVLSWGQVLKHAKCFIARPDPRISRISDSLCRLRKRRIVTKMI